MARDKGLLTDLQIRHWIKAGTPMAKTDGNGLTFTLSATGATIVIYPMNALANSQLEECKRSLDDV